MAVSVSSPEDVVNLALARIGYSKRIGSIYDGSPAAKLALTQYAQTRDMILRSADWGFATKTAALVDSGQAAPSPWSFSYSYPADGVRIRDLIVNSFDPLNPLPVRWVIQSNAVVGKVILTSVAYTSVVYTYKATNPAYWESAFVEALAAALGRRFTPLLNEKAVQLSAQDEAETAKAAVDEIE